VVGKHGSTEGIALEEHDAPDFALLHQTAQELELFAFNVAIMGINLSNKHLAHLFGECHFFQALFNTGVFMAENLPGTPLFRAGFYFCVHHFSCGHEQQEKKKGKERE